MKVAASLWGRRGIRDAIRRYACRSEGATVPPASLAAWADGVGFTDGVGGATLLAIRPGWDADDARPAWDRLRERPKSSEKRASLQQCLGQGSSWPNRVSARQHRGPCRPVAVASWMWQSATRKRGSVSGVGRGWTSGRWARRRGSGRRSRMRRRRRGLRAGDGGRTISMSSSSEATPCAVASQRNHHQRRPDFPYGVPNEEVQHGPDGGLTFTKAAPSAHASSTGGHIAPRQPGTLAPKCVGHSVETAGHFCPKYVDQSVVRLAELPRNRLCASQGDRSAEATANCVSSFDWRASLGLAFQPRVDPRLISEFLVACRARASDGAAGSPAPAGQQPPTHPDRTV